MPASRACSLEQFGPQFLFDERVRVADIDEDFVDARAILDQRDGVMLAPGRAVVAEIAGQRLLPPRHLRRRDDRREGRDAAEAVRDGSSATVSAPWPPIEWPVIACRSMSTGNSAATSAGSSSVT